MQLGDKIKRPNILEHVSSLQHVKRDEPLGLHINTMKFWSTMSGYNDLMTEVGEGIYWNMISDSDEFWEGHIGARVKDNSYTSSQ